MSRRNRPEKPYARAIESGIWTDPETAQIHWEAFWEEFTDALTSAPLEEKSAIMRRYGICFGPQR